MLSNQELVNFESDRLWISDKFVYYVGIVAWLVYLRCVWKNYCYNTYDEHKVRRKYGSLNNDVRFI